MKRNKTQFCRLLELDRRLRDGGYPNCQSFSLDWEVSQKTVQRDIDYLRDELRAPIEYDFAKKGFYYTRKNWFLPSISVSEGDLLAILVAEKAVEQYRGTPIATELERVFGKITDLLPDKITIRPELIFNKFSFTAPPSRAIDAGTWAMVVRGLVHQTRLQMSYKPVEHDLEDWLLEPLHMANLQGEWYLFGKCQGETFVRQFALGRIRKVALSGQRFEMPAGFDPRQLLANTFGRFAGNHSHTVRLLFAKKVALWVLEKQWGPRQAVRTRRNGDVEVVFSASGLLEVFRWVMAWGRWARVLAPAELRQMVDREIDAMGQGRKRSSPRDRLRS